MQSLRADLKIHAKYHVHSEGKTQHKCTECRYRCHVYSKLMYAFISKLEKVHSANCEGVIEFLIVWECIEGMLTASSRKTRSPQFRINLFFFVVFSQKSAFLVLERAHMAFSIEMTSTNSKLCIQWNFKEMERNFIQLEFHLGKILSISMTNLYGLHTMEYSISSIGRKLASLKDFNKALISLQHRIFASL